MKRKYQKCVTFLLFSGFNFLQIIIYAHLSFKEAADIISKAPSALQLRYLQTLSNITNEHSSTIVFPIPGSMDSFSIWLHIQYFHLFFFVSNLHWLISGEMLRGIFGEKETKKWIVHMCYQRWHNVNYSIK